MAACEAIQQVAHPYRVHNRKPTPQDLLELSSRIYKSTRKLYNEADSQGMRVYHDELITGDVRLVMIVPSWFPKAHVAFDWDRVQGDSVSVVFVLRGTMQDLVGNTKANLQLIYNKLVDDQHLPDTATDATKVIQAWLLTLLRRHPQLHGGSTALDDGQQHHQQQQQQEGLGAGRLHLDIHVAGHSLGGLLSEVATVESAGFANRHGADWHCTSFESPGLPDLYYDSALRIAPEEHWDEVITSYLAAPNVINMLYRHLGRIVHVVVPWEHTWTFMAKCVGADMARVTAWAIVGGMMVAGAGQIAGIARRRTEEEAMGHVAAAASNLTLQQCDARLPELAAAAAASTASASASAALSPDGPALPQFLLVAATPSSSSDTAAAAAAAAAGRRLLSVALPPPAAIAGAAASSTVAQQQAASLTGAVVGAAAAAGEAAASLGGARILHGVLRRSGVGTLVSLLGGFMFGRGGVWGVMECLAGVLGVEVEELICQHALGPMRQCFDPHTGQVKPRYCRKMASWPHLGTRGKVFLTAAKQVAKWTLPSFVCRDNLGVANIMSRTAMVEARCARLQGYDVLEDTAEARQALGLAVDAAAGGAFASASDMYMPLVEEPDTPLGQDHHHYQQQHQQHALQGQHSRMLALPPPRGLGTGLVRYHHTSRHMPQHGHMQQQQQQTLHMLQEAAEAGQGMRMAPRPAAAAGPSARQFWAGDDAAAMAVDGAEAAAEGMFADAVDVAFEDLVCEGLPMGSGDGGLDGGVAAGQRAFIQLQDMGSSGLGGAFEAVQLPHGSAASEQFQCPRHGLMQLHFNS